LRGMLISLEGPDGCGKSTHARLLSEWLRSMGMRVLLTKEPTNSVFGTTIKKALGGRITLPPEAEAVLFAADRAHHVSRIIEPALRRGMIVISERYVHSSLAYQPARGVPEDFVRELNRHVPRPDLTIILDAPTRETMRRVKPRGPDLFERSSGFQGAVRRNYLKLAREEGLTVIDTSGPKEEVQGRIREVVARALKIPRRATCLSSRKAAGS
jgi:dTMP kinase